MSTQPQFAGEILRRFDALKSERGIEFRPPQSKEHLGELAFPVDVVQAILIGVATGVLKDLIVSAIKTGAAWMKSKAEVKTALQRLRQNSETIRDGLEKLRSQGFNTADAETAALDQCYD